MKSLGFSSNTLSSAAAMSRAKNRNITITMLQKSIQSTILMDENKDIVKGVKSERRRSNEEKTLVAWQK